jgi:hypothetical protein
MHLTEVIKGYVFKIVRFFLILIDTQISPNTLIFE